MGRKKSEKRAIMDEKCRLAAADIVADFPWAKGLSYKQTLYVIAYTGDNAAACAAIGIPVDVGARWQEEDRVRYALRQRLTYGLAPQLCAGKEERKAFWSATMRDPSQDLRDRMRASELLGRSESDFVETRILQGGTSPVQIVVQTGVPAPDAAVDDAIEDSTKWVNGALSTTAAEPSGDDESDDDDEY